MKSSCYYHIVLTATILLHYGARNTYGWKAIRRGAEQGDDYGALVSGIRNNVDWCIAASNGVGIGANIGFRRCNGSARQLWKLEDGKWHSKVNSNRCIAVETGLPSAIKDGSHLRMANCSKAHKFEFDIEIETGFIRVKSKPSFCVVNTGVTPESTDLMIVKPCSTVQKRFEFTYLLPTGYVGYNNDDAFPVGGCLVVKDENARAGQPLILGSCDLNHDWRLDAVRLFHTQLNDTMCMQADPASGQGIAKGVPMRLYPCEVTNEYQKFILNGVDIRLRGYDSLCVGFRGVTSQVGVDPLVLKECGENGDNWSHD